jgi:hypothetical protein
VTFGTKTRRVLAASSACVKLGPVSGVPFGIESISLEPFPGCKTLALQTIGSGIRFVLAPQLCLVVYGGAAQFGEFALGPIGRHLEGILAFWLFG